MTARSSPAFKAFTFVISDALSSILTLTATAYNVKDVKTWIHKFNMALIGHIFHMARARVNNKMMRQNRLADGEIET